MPSIKRSIRYILYTLGGILFFAVSYLFFLYYLFPYATFENYIVGYIESATGAGINVGKGKIAFPLKMIWNEVDVERDELSFNLKMIDISIQPVALIKGTGDLSFNVKGLGGSATGRITGSKKSNATLPYSMELAGENITLKDIDIGYKDTRVGGKATIDLKAKWPSDIIFATGYANGKIANLEFTDVMAGLFTFEKIIFPEVLFKIDFDNGKVAIKDLKTLGGDFNVNGKGNLTIKKSLPRSQINISGSFSVKEGSEFEDAVKIFSNGKNKLRFSLTGTMARPRLKINNIPLGL